MKRLKQFTIVTISALMVLVPKSIINACGFWAEPGEYRFWLLQPDLTNTDELTPFFFASYYLYKGDMYAGGQPYILQNIEEWQKEIDKKASRIEIDTILNHTEPQLFFESYKTMADKNAFLRYLLRSDKAELFEYLAISKKIENLQGGSDPWGERNISPDIYHTILREADVLNKKTESSFIKLRSAYQMIRLYYLINQNAKAEELYNSQVGPVKTNSWIKTAALYQVALHKEGAEKDYFYSKVFDRGAYNRVSCLVYFNSGNTDSVMLFAKNEHERTVAKAMKVFNYKGKALRDIQHIYNAEPDYKELSFLLLREVNKIEDMLVTGKVTEFLPVSYSSYEWEPGFNQKIYKEDRAYAASVYDFIVKVINEKKNKDNSLLNLYASHLSMLLGNNETSLQHLQAAKSSNTPANVRTQLRVNSLLLNLQMDKLSPASIEAELADILLTPDDKLGVYDPAIMKDQLILYCGRKMIEKGRRAKGLMLLGKTHRALGQLPIDTYKRVYQEIDEIALPADYDEMISVITKKDKTAFEKFIGTGRLISAPYYYSDDEDEKNGWNVSRLLDKKSSWYIRNNRLKEAMTVLNKVPDGYWKEWPYDQYINGDAFYVDVYDPYAVPATEKGYNKKQVVAEMIRLQDIADRDPSQAAICNYKLGNAWYNMTYYGKNWLMVRQWWSMNEPDFRGRQSRTAFYDNYFGCNRAKEYYLKSMKQTKDKKLASLNCYMAGKCFQNFESYIWSLRSDNYNQEFKTSPNPYVKNLKQNGMDDVWYKEVVKECATYNSFIKLYAKK